MDLSQKKSLIAVNNKFYQQTATAFSASRQNFWSGWEQLPFPSVAKPMRILDVAAGNMRFQQFLTKKYSQFNYLAVDGCPELLQESDTAGEKYLVLDILGEMIEGNDWRTKLPSITNDATWDFIFCCAFLHHVPGRDWRQQLLGELYELLTSGGYLAVTFWQFIGEQSFAHQIEKDLGDNDYLLSWHAGGDATRYVHNFTDEEVDGLSQNLLTLGAKVIADYQADGRTGKMNRYLVWSKP